MTPGQRRWAAAMEAARADSVKYGIRMRVHGVRWPLIVGVIEPGFYYLPQAALTPRRRTAVTR